MKVLDENPVHVIADEGKVLTDGEVYSTEIWLGINDSPANWREIPEEEVPTEEQL